MGLYGGSQPGAGVKEVLRNTLLARMWVRALWEAKELAGAAKRPFSIVGSTGGARGERSAGAGAWTSRGGRASASAGGRVVTGITGSEVDGATGAPLAVRCASWEDGADTGEARGNDDDEVGPTAGGARLTGGTGTDSAAADTVSKEVAGVLGAGVAAAWSCSETDWAARLRAASDWYTAAGVGAMMGAVEGTEPC